MSTCPEYCEICIFKNAMNYIFFFKIVEFNFYQLSPSKSNQLVGETLDTFKNRNFPQNQSINQLKILKACEQHLQLLTFPIRKYTRDSLGTISFSSSNSDNASWNNNNVYLIPCFINVHAQEYFVWQRAALWSEKIVLRKSISRGWTTYGWQS